MKKLLLIIVFAFTAHTYAQTPVTELSCRFLEAVRDEQPTAQYVEEIASLSVADLTSQLTTDREKKTFWINLYNGYIIYLLRDNPGLFEDRGEFFSEPRVKVAGQMLSFDEIEHGILRRSKNKLSLGYVGKIFVGDFEKDMRVEEVDWRIHFALNCGAAACPPVEVYTVGTFESRIQLRARSYLEKTTRYNEAANEVEVTTLMNWFRADFGGEDGVIRILRSFDLVPQEADPDITYSGYDWTLDIDNFAE